MILENILFICISLEFVYFLYWREHFWFCQHPGVPVKRDDIEPSWSLASRVPHWVCFLSQVLVRALLVGSNISDSYPAAPPEFFFSLRVLFFCCV